MSAKNYQKGVTLVESMIGLAIIAILSAVALPSFNSYLASVKVKSIAESIYGGLQVARTEAIRNNKSVVFALDAGNNWVVTLGSNFNQAVSPCDSSVRNFIRRSCGENSGVQNNTSANSLFNQATFTSLGRVSAAYAGAAIPAPRLDLAAGYSSLSLLISPGGQVRVCDPTASPPSATDPKYCVNNV